MIIQYLATGFGQYGWRYSYPNDPNIFWIACNECEWIVPGTIED